MLPAFTAFGGHWSSTLLDYLSWPLRKWERMSKRRKNEQSINYLSQSWECNFCFLFFTFISNRFHYIQFPKLYTFWWLNKHLKSVVFICLWHFFGILKVLLFSFSSLLWKDKKPNKLIMNDFILTGTSIKRVAIINSTTFILALFLLVSLKCPQKGDIFWV